MVTGLFMDLHIVLFTGLHLIFITVMEVVIVTEVAIEAEAAITMVDTADKIQEGNFICLMKLLASRPVFQKKTLPLLSQRHMEVVAQ